MCCFKHNIIHKINNTEKKKGHKSIAITPRHFLDFIKHFISLFSEKRHALEDEKIHINNGLKKIQETQEQVKELQLSLNAKRSELEEKKQAAEAKLKQMLSDQNEAEREKKISESLQGELRDQLGDIAQKKEQVGGELATVRPDFYYNFRTRIILLFLRLSLSCKVPRMQCKESKRVSSPRLSKICGPFCHAICLIIFVVQINGPTTERRQIGTRIHLPLAG